MPSKPLDPVLRHVRRAAALAGGRDLNDDQLLERFVAGRDGEAFATLVHRYGRLVHSVCRRVLRHEHDTDDAFQATFLVFASRAASIRKTGSVASWLYGVAYRTAMNARRANRRRDAQQTEVDGVSKDQPFPRAVLREVQAILEDEVNRLPEKHRAAFLLCCLEGKSKTEAARQLGWKEGTVSSSLARARKELQRRLARRGVVLSAALGVVALDQAAARAAAAPALVQATITAGLALAAGEAALTDLVSARVAALAKGATQTMATTRLTIATALLLLVGLLTGAGLLAQRVPAASSPEREQAQEPGPGPGTRPARAPSDARKLPGVWLAEAGERGGASIVPYVWLSRLTLSADSFTLSRFMDMPRDVKGSFTLDPAAKPKAIDLKVEEFDLSGFGFPLKVPTVTLPGIYRLDDDRLTVCFPTEPGRKRPTDFTSGDQGTVVATLGRADAGFREFPKDVTITVNDPDGKPVTGASVFQFMSLRENRETKEAPRDWQYYEPVQTGADGTVTIPYGKLRFQPASARHTGRKLIGFAPLSPHSLQKGTVTVALRPECRLSGTIVCDDLKQAGKPMAWINVYLLQDGKRIADCDSSEGLFEFVVPPGTYALYAYGTDLGKKTVSVTVPADRRALRVDPISLPASKLLLLEGQPAPELEGVVGWKGAKVKLADLRGQYVLLEFWGYWCGPCVQAMPILFELHEKFKDRGLTIVTIHLDIDGEVDSAAKLDEKVAGFRKGLWGGKDLPFPVALTSGKRIDTGAGDPVRSGPVEQYGVLSYPTTVLIDREGKVLGRFHSRGAKAAAEEIEKLLNRKP
jgi:RNA polymerase sigma factor (sigma-70 family)